MSTNINDILKKLQDEFLEAASNGRQDIIKEFVDRQDNKNDPNSTYYKSIIDNDKIMNQAIQNAVNGSKADSNESYKIIAETLSFMMGKKPPSMQKALDNGVKHVPKSIS